MNTDRLTLVHGDTWWISFTALGDMTRRTQSWFTLKRRATDIDSAALVQISETGHLLALNGAVPLYPWDGVIVVIDPRLGSGWVVLRDSSSVLLPLYLYGLEYDIQWEDANGANTPQRGQADIVSDATGAI